MKSAKRPAAADPMAGVVQALAAHGIVRNYPRNAVIITEGDPSDSLYVILSGSVKVYLMVSRIFKDLTAGGYVTVDRGRIYLRRALPSRW